MKVTDIDQLLNAYKEMQHFQSVIDDLSENVHFKQGLKNRANLLQKEIDKTLRPLYKSMSETEKESFNRIILSGESLTVQK